MTDHKAARTLYEEQREAVLSTHSVDVPDYPFGSVVPYAVAENGHAVIVISNLAQHYKNIKANPKVSLTILEAGGKNVQARGRLTYLADATPVDAGDQDARERYYKHFPEAREFTESHGFFFYRLKPVKLRFIGGFGNISWVAPEAFFRV
jgi:heme iron utilization protein